MDRMSPKKRVISANLVWIVGTFVSLAFLGFLTIEMVFIVSLIGFILITEFTAPFGDSPRWRILLDAVIVLGFLLFGYIVIRRILEALPVAVL